MKRMLATAAALAALLAGAALAAGAKPDAHDRALARALDARVQTFRDIAAKRGGNDSLQHSLARCPLMKKDPSQAFAALFAVLPAVVTQLVNDYGPQLRELQQMLLGMNPHAGLFRRWTAAEAKSFGLLLRFDNHGKKIDLCDAATVMLDKKSTPADVQRVLGIDPSLIAVLFRSPAGAALAGLNPQMRAFFIAAGLLKADAKILTS